MPKKDTTKNLIREMLVSPNKKLTRKKGKIGTILTKNKQNIPFVIKLLFIFFNVFSNFFSKKSFIVYLEIKKLTDAPKEEARAIKSNALKIANGAQEVRVQ